MDKKITAIISYIAPIGWLIAYLAGDREGAKFQLNQSLVLWITFIVAEIVAAILGKIPFIGAIITAVISLALLALWILGLVHAIKEEDTPLPVIGGFTLLK